MFLKTKVTITSLVLALVFTSFAYAQEKIFIRYADFCDVYAIELYANNTLAGNEIGCNSSDNPNILGSYIQLKKEDGFVKSNLIMLLSFTKNGTVFSEVILPLTGKSSFYADSNNDSEPLIITDYEMSDTIGSGVASKQELQ